VRITGAFQAAFAEAGLTAVWPEDEAPVLALIRAVKAGRSGPAEGEALRALAATLVPRCDHLLVACTELSLLTPALPEGGWTDSLDCLVARIRDYSSGAT
jgi:aspartate racemase